ncbi:MAG: hypothetical protein NEHIOOID_01220 [Holosporales bacterium]
MVAYFKMDLPQIGLFLLMLISISHARMGIDVVLDDYINNEKQRKAIEFLEWLFMSGGVFCLFSFKCINFYILSVCILSVCIIYAFLHFSLRRKK